MKTILTGVLLAALLGLAACDSEPQKNAASADQTAAADSSAATAQAPANPTPAPNAVTMPTAAPPIPAYGPATSRTTPYYFPPTGLGSP
jgi:hypothetical protein